MVFVLNYSGKKIKFALCITKSETASLKAREILSNLELKQYDLLQTELGRLQYLLGRYSAKKAISQIVDNKIVMSEIDIRNGIFEQPFFVDNSGFEVSITHTKGIGGAIVFDKAYPMGLDIEGLNKSKVEFLQEIIRAKEIKRLSTPHEITLTIAWCLKEALSKAIRTGLTIPFELLEVEGLMRADVENVFQCRFKNFTQYKGIAKIRENYVVALAYPKQLTVGDI